MVGIKMTKAIWELVNPEFKEVFYGVLEKVATQKRPDFG